MLNKLKTIRDSISEKTKAYVYIGTALLVLAISCLLPLAFSNSAAVNEVSRGEKAAIFVKYVNKDKSVRYKVNNKPTNAQLKFCESVFDDIVSMSISDSASRNTLNEGTEYITLSYKDDKLELCRMWLQDQGDWTNWLDVYFDAQTGEILYLYISRVCVYNNNKYINADMIVPDCKSIASSLSEESGYEIKLLNWSGKSEDTATAYTVLDGDALIWSINCIYHSSSIVDIKISVA